MRTLKTLGYSLQGNRKTLEGSGHVDRDAQFGHIAETVKEAITAGQPAISVRATARTVETRALRIEASRDNAERLTLAVPGRDEPIVPTHWSYGQLCSLVGAPASYMRQLPAPLAGVNLQHGLLSHRAELVKTSEADDCDDGKVVHDGQAGVVTLTVLTCQEHSSVGGSTPRHQPRRHAAHPRSRSLALQGRD